MGNAGSSANGGEATSIDPDGSSADGAAIKARSVVIDGKVEGPISGEDVVLKSQAFVTGDIQAQTLLIERGAHFEGRSSQELLGL